MKIDTFRLKTGQTYTFTATRPCRVRIARSGAARFTVTFLEYMPGMATAAAESVEVQPETAAPKGKKRS